MHLFLFFFRTFIYRHTYVWSTSHNSLPYMPKELRASRSQHTITSLTSLYQSERTLIPSADKATKVQRVQGSEDRVAENQRETTRSRRTTRPGPSPEGLRHTSRRRTSRRAPPRAYTWRRGHRRCTSGCDRRSSG